MKISCKMCGANLKFLPSTQKAYCEHCGSKFEPETIEYDDSIYDECDQYTCSSCGAELLSFGKMGVISCVYCGGKEFVKGKANKEYILQGVFPFKVDREQFIKSYEEYFKPLSDVDEEFRKKAKEANVTSLYLPYSFANSFFRKQYSKELNNLLEEIIPFDFKELKNMNPIYFDNCLAEIVKIKKEENDIKTNDPSFYWVPIWLAEIEFESRMYYIVMNGQTWKMAGVLKTTGETIRKQKKKFYIRRAIKFTGFLLSIVFILVCLTLESIYFLVFLSTEYSFPMFIVLFFSLILMLFWIIKSFENIKETITEKRIEKKLVKRKKVTKMDLITQNTTKKFHLSPQQNKIRKTRK